MFNRIILFCLVAPSVISQTNFGLLIPGYDSLIAHRLPQFEDGLSKLQIELLAAATQTDEETSGLMALEVFTENRPVYTRFVKLFSQVIHDSKVDQKMADFLITSAQWLPQVVQLLEPGNNQSSVSFHAYALIIQKYDLLSDVQKALVQRALPQSAQFLNSEPLRQAAALIERQAQQPSNSKQATPVSQQPQQQPEQNPQSVKQQPQQGEKQPRQQPQQHQQPKQNSQPLQPAQQPQQPKQGQQLPQQPQQSQQNSQPVQLAQQQPQTGQQKPAQQSQQQRQQPGLQVLHVQM